MTDVDTSSYPKPQLPVSPLDTAAKLGGIQQQQQQIESTGLSIDKQKLDLLNQHFGLLNHEVSTLANDPNVTKPQIIERLNSFADMVKMPTAIRQKMLNEAQSVPPGQEHDYLDHVMRRNMDTQQQLNNQYGTPQMTDNGQQITPVSVSQQKQTMRPMGAPIQRQLPPETPVVTPGGTQALGPQAPQAPAGALPVAGGLPGQFRAPRPPAAPAGAISGPAIAGPSANFGGTVVSAEAEAPTFKDRFNSAYRPAGPMVSRAPGATEALTTEAQGGASALVNDRAASNSFQREIFPLTQAIPALEKLGPKGTGPGTDTINQLKSFAISMVPGVKENDFDGVKDYDKAKKYLTDFVNQTGSSGTNDKLAAAFAGNPSVHISNAAAVDVAKSALALRRMKQSQIVEFEKSGLPPQDYQKWSVRFNNEQDPRAYGVDMMGKDKLNKLLKSMSPDERKAFNNSLIIAHNSKSIAPLGQQ